MKNIFIVIFIFSISNNLLSQTEVNRKYFSIFFSAGTALNTPINYYFFGETKDRILNPGVYGNIGLQYGPFKVIDLSELFFSVSVAYTKVSTSEFQLENFPSNAQLTIETFPVLCWCRLKTNTKISPFVEIGMGISKLNFIEKYSDRLNGTSFSHWALATCFGAGINYDISENIGIDIQVQVLSNEKEKLVENDRNHLSGIPIRNVVNTISLKAIIKI